MKYANLIMFSVLFLYGGAVSCNSNHSAMVANNTNYDNESNNKNKTKDNRMKIKIGSNNFDATLFENETATAFKALLPLTIKMDELYGSEKKYDFSDRLPTNSTNPKTINSSDLMIWGSNTLVLFYKTFPTQYSYAKLGKIDDPSGLEATVGAGDVTVTFELE